MKNLMLFVLLIFTVSIFAHEVTANLSIVDDEAMGFELVKANLWWGEANYLVDFDVYYTDNQPIDLFLSQAWKKVDLWGLADFTIGKQTYSFGNILSSKGYKNLQIQRLEVAPLGWMGKVHKEMGKLNFYVDGVWPKVGAADLNGRIAYETKLLTIGGAVTFGNFVEYFKKDGNTLGAYEFDLDYTAANFIRIYAQFTNTLADAEENYCFIASYAPGFEIPYMGKLVGRVMYGEWRPYLGMISRNDAAGDGMGESNTFLGINYQSFENSYIKLELNLDSDEDIDPTFLMQMGYRF
ncbi:MAG: hypothetical protein Q7J16_07790 [Candidatus Cloacimonadales bacterium]|nr:hypothetical protein [Candidatus Cloacimonadales bacterium]